MYDLVLSYELRVVVETLNYRLETLVFAGERLEE